MLIKLIKLIINLILLLLFNNKQLENCWDKFNFLSLTERYIYHFFFYFAD